MTSGSLPDDLRDELAAWEAAGLRRTLTPPSGIDFSSNDYLGLSRHPDVVAAAHAALDEAGAGAPSARLLRGNLDVHARVEAACAEWLGTEAALLLPSGWHANLAVIGALTGRGDLVLSDALNHASLVDACRLSRARVEIHRHHDPEHVDALLRTARGARRRIVVAESVESTSGARAPLAELAEVCRRHDAWLVVDEAHAAGLLGPEGAGLAAEAGVLDRVLARVITGGKALGVAGAFVAGSRDVIELLLHRGRPFVFTTAVAPPVAAALTAAIGVVRREPGLARAAHRAAARLRAALAAADVATTGAGSIVPVPVAAGPDAAVRVAAALQERGFDVRALRPPTVPPGGSRLRIVCRAGHDDATIDALASALADALGDAPAAPPPAGATSRVTVVLGTDTGVGKTVVSALLCRALARADAAPRYLKPVQTGTDSDTESVRRLAGLDEGHAPDPVVALPLPASVDQAARDAGVSVTAREVLAGIHARVSGATSSRWIVEGAGGLLVPLNDGEDLGDVLAGRFPDVVLVARSGLGTLNHTLLTVEALTRRRARLRAVVLVGPRHAANETSLRARIDAPVLSLPVLDPVTATSLDAWLDAHDVAELLA